MRNSFFVAKCPQTDSPQITPACRPSCNDWPEHTPIAAKSMDSALSILTGVVVLATFLFLVAYVTWGFAVRLRSKQSPSKSFLQWLKDLFDLAQGL